jgi:acetamidase/formamidase
MGFDEDLDLAAKMALREMIEYLGEEKGIKPEQAYMLASLAVDLRITQLVNTVKGVHAMLPKRLFTGGQFGSGTRA